MNTAEPENLSEGLHDLHVHLFMFRADHAERLGRIACLALDTAALALKTAANAYRSHLKESVWKAEEEAQLARDRAAGV